MEPSETLLNSDSLVVAALMLLITLQGAVIVVLWRDNKDLRAMVTAIQEKMFTALHELTVSIKTVLGMRD